MKTFLLIFLLFPISFCSFTIAQNCQVSLSPASTIICPGTPVQIQSTVNTANIPCQLSDLPLNLQNGLVGWYPFCGNANDMSGNNNHGTVIGATLAPDRFGNSNMAYYFDGVSNSIVIQNSNSLNVDSLTIVTFIRPDPGLGQAILVAKSDSTNATSYSYHLNYEALWSGNQGFCAAWGDGNCSPPSSINASVVFAPQGLFNSSNWNMASMKIYSNGYGELYKDTTLVGSGSTGIPLVSCNSPSSTVRIGGVWWPGHPQRFKGHIDDVFIYNRPVSQAELAQLLYLSNNNPNPITYTWSTGATTQSITVSPTISTTYTLTVNTSTSSCNAQSVVTVIPTPLQFTGSNSVIGGQTSQYTANAYSGFPYVWSVHNGLITSGQGTSSIQVQWFNTSDSGNVQLNFCQDSFSLSVKIDSVIYGKQCLKRYLPPNLQNGLNAFYPFCGDATDQSGNNNHGTTYGLTLVPDRFGNLNSTYLFNGAGDHIVAQNSNSLSIDSGTFVVFLTPDPGSTDGLILAKSDSMDATDYAYHLVHEAYWQNNTGFFGAWGDGNCNVPSSINANYVFAPNFLTSQNWQMVAVSVNSAGVGKLYKNGVLISTVNSTYPIGNCNNTNSTLRIGGPWWIGVLNWYKGEIDDILIYNRVLDSTEIVQLYNHQPVTAENLISTTEPEVKTYPNPSNGNFTIEIENNQLPAELAIISCDGRVLLKQTLESNNTNIDSELLLVKGLYFIQVKNSKGEGIYSGKHIQN